MRTRDALESQSDLVSIIVPAFNPEEYFERCILSLCSQTYTNIEVLVIDDGSSDTHVKFIESVCGNDGRVRIIKSESYHYVSHSMNNLILKRQILKVPVRYIWREVLQSTVSLGDFYIYIYIGWSNILDFGGSNIFDLGGRKISLTYVRI